MKTRSQNSNTKLNINAIILWKKLREALDLRDLESAKTILLDIYELSNQENEANLIKSTSTAIQILHLAVILGNTKLVDYIFKNNLVKSTNAHEDLNKILHISVELGHLPIVKYLIKNKLVDATSKIRGKDILYAATMSFHLDVIKYIVENNLVKLSDLNSHKENVLCLVIMLGHPDIAEYLLKKEIIDIDRTVMDIPEATSLDSNFLSIFGSLSSAITQYKENSPTSQQSKKYLNIIELLLKKGVKLSENVFKELVKTLPETAMSAYAADLVYSKKDLKIKFDTSKISKDIFLSRLKHYFQKHGINFDSFKKYKGLFEEKYKAVLTKELFEESLQYFDTLQKDLIIFESLFLSALYNRGIPPLTKTLEYWSNTKEDKEVLEIHCKAYPKYKKFLEKVADGNISQEELAQLQTHIKDNTPQNAPALIRNLQTDIIESVFYREEFREFVNHLLSKKVLPYVAKRFLTKTTQIYNEIDSFSGNKEEFIAKYSKLLPKKLFENILKSFETTIEEQDFDSFYQGTVNDDSDTEMVTAGDCEPIE